MKKKEENKTISAKSVTDCCALIINNCIVNWSCTSKYSLFKKWRIYSNGGDLFSKNIVRKTFCF